MTNSVIDFENVYTESSSKTAIVLMFTEKSDTLGKHFSVYAKSKVNNKFTIIDINEIEVSDEKTLIQLISKPMEEGSWVLLLNCQNSVKLLNQIENTLQENDMDPNFRCWVALKQKLNDVPSSLMLNSIRAFVSSPLTMKENIVRAFNLIESEQFKVSNKVEWPILLHNLAYFHSCLKLRLRYTRYGWNMPSTLTFTTEEFLDALQGSAHEYQQQNDETARAESGKIGSEINKVFTFQAIKFIVANVSDSF
jgi:hypothetical protein